MSQPGSRRAGVKQDNVGADAPRPPIWLGCGTLYEAKLSDGVPIAERALRSSQRLVSRNTGALTLQNPRIVASGEKMCAAQLPASPPRHQGQVPDRGTGNPWAWSWTPIVIGKEKFASGAGSAHIPSVDENADRHNLQPIKSPWVHPRPGLGQVKGGVIGSSEAIPVTVSSNILQVS